MMKRCWISWASPGFCSVTHLTDSVTLTVLYVREPMHLWVTLQHFATVMPHIGEWATHPFSRHILTHSPSGWLHQPLRELTPGGVTCKKRLTLVEHRISAASGYREQPASLLLAEEPRGGGFHDSAAAFWHGSSFFPFLSICQHTTYLLHHFSLSLSLLQISAHLSQYRLEVGGFPGSKRIMTFHWFIDDIIQTCNVTNMPCCRMI